MMSGSNILNLCYNGGAKREVKDQENRPGGSIKEQNASTRRAVKAIISKKLYIRKRNNILKIEAFRGVRRPGRNHGVLLQVLDQLLGDLDTKKAVVRDVIEEALRFKRRALAQILEEYMVELEMKQHHERLAKCPKCKYIHACPCNRFIG